MQVRLESVGCRLNIGEIEAMARGLAKAGHRVVGPGTPAELCILNTCTVTAIASRKSRQLIRQIKRANPSAAVIVTGCDAELAPSEMAEIGVDLVVGNAEKERLLELAEAEGLLDAASIDPDDQELFEPGDSTRTRAFLKVQDGCDNRCTFCVITIARGAGRSVPADAIMEELHDLQRLGYREVVLSGVHLGSYGHDLGDQRGLQHLVGRALAETAVERLRLSSLEPWDLDAGFFEVFADPRLLPHLHLPLQSGCDETLKRMARRTSRAEFSKLVRDARRAVPGLAISSDIIVGFPGETDEEFEQSIALVEELAFSRLHIFRYSRRAGTPAEKMTAQVPGPIAQDRSRRLHALAADLEHRFNSTLVGHTADVLWETAEDHGDALRWSGLTPNYVRVTATTSPDEDLLNVVTPTEIVEVVPGGVV
ncbi:MAG: tRNA (N(6)-L-threonylcarbamoyladenosine(37)-C(2))-methylthiotransferase MtaB, partial [Thermoanaerobaculales bacterium]|nr:tRNA (N(6)-L-threonylcarbamoyladenosine(37)-C(2))-methylthiotransferase MtaB [Thermoanaerobaculales bacterium]